MNKEIFFPVNNVVLSSFFVKKMVLHSSFSNVIIRTQIINPPFKLDSTEILLHETVHS